MEIRVQWKMHSVYSNFQNGCRIVLWFYQFVGLIVWKRFTFCSVYTHCIVTCIDFQALFFQKNFRTCLKSMHLCQYWSSILLMEPMNSELWATLFLKNHANSASQYTIVKSFLILQVMIRTIKTTTIMKND